MKISSTAHKPVELTRQLANWCANQDLRFTESAIARAREAIMDTVACMFAGASDPAVAATGRIVPNVPSGRSSSVRHASPVSARDAAMINGCAAHALDFDDIFPPAITHGSAVLVPALFALGEEIGSSGKDVANAFIVGLEIQAQIGGMVNPEHYASGWHATSTIGTIGAAAACAALMKLDSDKIAHAMSIASSLAGGSKKQFGSMVKPAHAGFAAEHAVRAAQLAQAGMEGDPETLQGKWSFAELHAGNSESATFTPTLFPDAPLAIDDNGPSAKLYPSCAATHLGIDGVLALRGRHDLKPKDIEAVEVHMPKFMIENLRYANPESEMQARFSMNYCAAVALVDGVPCMSHFSPAAFQNNAAANPEVERLLKHVSMYEREAPPDTTALPFGTDCIVRISTKRGEVLEHIAKYPKGSRENPLTPEEQRTKFSDCAAAHLDKEKAPHVYSRLLDFTNLEAIDSVTQTFRKARRDMARL